MTEDALELLVHENVAQKINDIVDRTDETIDHDAFFEALVRIAENEGLTHKELADRPDRSVRYAERTTKPFRDAQPGLIVKKSDGKYHLNKTELLRLKKGKVAHYVEKMKARAA